MSGISSVLLQLAEASTAHAAKEKQAFVPMPGGQLPPPPMDPMAAMGGGGGAPPMDPMAAMGGGGGAPPMDPMAMAAMGQDPAAILAAGGAPVDPMMAAAGGAPGIAPPPAPEAAPADAAAPGKGGGQKEKLDEIHGMLTKVMGVLVGKGLLGPEALGGMMGIQGGDAPPDSPPAGGDAAGTPPPMGGGIPPEQKVATDALVRVGSVVDDLGDLATAVTPEQAPAVKHALADLILSLRG